MMSVRISKQRKKSMYWMILVIPVFTILTRICYGNNQVMYGQMCQSSLNCLGEDEECVRDFSEIYGHCVIRDDPAKKEPHEMSKLFGETQNKTASAGDFEPLSPEKRKRDANGIEHYVDDSAPASHRRRTLNLDITGRRRKRRKRRSRRKRKRRTRKKGKNRRKRREIKGLLENLDEFSSLSTIFRRKMSNLSMRQALSLEHALLKRNSYVDVELRDAIHKLQNLIHKTNKYIFEDEPFSAEELAEAVTRAVEKDEMEEENVQPPKKIILGLIVKKHTKPSKGSATVVQEKKENKNRSDHDNGTKIKINVQHKIENLNKQTNESEVLNIKQTIEAPINSKNETVKESKKKQIKINVVRKVDAEVKTNKSNTDWKTEFRKWFRRRIQKSVEHENQKATIN